MNKVVFESDRDDSYLFGTDGNTVFDMDFGNGVSVNIGTSQGFSQVGNTVESMAVGSRTITVRGAVYGDVADKKTQLRKIFAPFTWGRLVIDDKFYIRVCVKDSPTFSTARLDGRFTMRLFAPFPFFYFLSQKNILIGGITPAFSFPVNYGSTHTFGTRSTEKYSTILNDGDVSVPLNVFMESFGTSVNPKITNMETFEYLQLNGTIGYGESVSIYRDENNVLRAELLSGDEPTDIISWIDEGSTLFMLSPGDNLIGFDDDNDGASLSVRFQYSPAVVNVYES